MISILKGHTSIGPGPSAVGGAMQGRGARPALWQMTPDDGPSALERLGQTPAVGGAGQTPPHGPRPRPSALERPCSQRPHSISPAPRSPSFSPKCRHKGVYKDGVCVTMYSEYGGGYASIGSNVDFLLELAILYLQYRTPCYNV
eukprot:GHVO01064717.1.p1 GENE.GHVO01064717.1~~GHVO01064717.1.p1  ORF type:complete len:144 (+),score=12.25 GHVO01064717.1:374-805(+)